MPKDPAPVKRKVSQGGRSSGGFGYEVRRALLSGAYVEVYEATARLRGDFERRVLLKRLKPDHVDDPRLREAFLGEARVVAQLQHVNVISVLDFGTDEAGPFIALEYLDGLDLENAAAGAPLPPFVALHVTVEVLRALEHAHDLTDERGAPLAIAHGDLGPHAVMLSWSGDVKLSAWSVARSAHLDVTTIGQPRGSVDFMAPERRDGRPADRRSDLYSVGKLLRWMSTGTAGIDHATFTDERALREVIDIATANDAKDRYADAGAMIDAVWPLLVQHAERDGRRATCAWLVERRDLFADTSLQIVAGLARDAVRTERAPAPQIQAPESSVTARDDSAIGALVHGYRIEALVARGGWGDVYRARHTTLGHLYAVKVLGRQITSPNGAKRLAREAKAMSRLVHDNVVPVLDNGQLPDGRPFLTMPFLEGRTLHQIIGNEGPFSNDRAASFVRQIAEGLDAAHAQGIIHRDLKPGNVFVSEEGGVERARILDFGIARVVEDGRDQTQLTAPDRLLGTPWYVAPEQIRAPSDVTGAADVYSLGIVLYRMLRIEPPFAGAATDVLEQHLLADPPPVDGPLGAVLAQMLAKHPDQRPTPRALVEQLDAIGYGIDTARTRVKSSSAGRSVSGDPVSSGMIESVAFHDPTVMTPTRLDPSAPSRPRRTPWAAIGAVVVVVIAASALATALLLAPEPPPVAYAPAVPQPGAQAAPRVQPGAQPKPVAPSKAPEAPPPSKPAKLTKRAPPKSVKKGDAVRQARRHLWNVLSTNGLAMADVEASASLAAAVTPVQAALRAADPAAAERLIAEVERVAPSASADPKLIDAKLRRVQKLLSRVAPTVATEKVKAFEDRFFALSSTSPGTDALRRQLTVRIAALERDLLRAK